MRIFDVLVDAVPADARIVDVSVGIFWTFVQTQYGCALSATAHRWVEEPFGVVIPWAGELVGKRVLDLVELYDGVSLTGRALANAAVSAAFGTLEGGRFSNGSTQELLLSLCRESARPLHVALVGHFHFAEVLRPAVHRLDVYELDHRCQPGDIPATCMAQRLAEADIVVMTSSTLLTHAAEAVLSYCRKDAVKMMVGPGAPLHRTLWDFGFDVIGGSIVRDVAGVRLAVGQGGAHKQLPGVEKVNYWRV
ncbi:MAG: DUF364 domain-containing protein [Proteobacteria bacterium]|nr:DUF364 domain-containing protein [Pseudomonadota bacterium]